MWSLSYITCYFDIFSNIFTNPGLFIFKYLRNITLKERLAELKYRSSTDRIILHVCVYERDSKRQSNKCLLQQERAEVSNQRIIPCSYSQK